MRPDKVPCVKIYGQQIYTLFLSLYLNHRHRYSNELRRLRINFILLVFKTLKYYINALCFRDNIYMHKVIIFNEMNKRKPIIIHLHLERGFLLLFCFAECYKN